MTTSRASELALANGVPRWTLALDESGAFEGRLVAGQRDERAGFVVGGVLLPGSARDTALALDGFRLWCASSVGWPPHASELDQGEKLALALAAAEGVAALGGAWIFVVSDARSPSESGAIGRFVRMFGATIDLVGRLLSALGARELDAVPASRSVPLSLEHLEQAAAAGVATLAPPAPKESPRAKAMLQAETRHALDALGREASAHLGPWPTLTSVHVASARSPSAHPGLALADVGCNRVYSGLWSQASLSEVTAPLATSPLLILRLESLKQLRAVDRLLREPAPDLVGAARLVTRLEGDERSACSDNGGEPRTASAAALIARTLWERALPRLAKTAASEATANALAARAQAELVARTGAYDSTALALEAGFCGAGPLAAATRARTTDRVLSVRLWRMYLECANHRGDVQTACLARDAALAVLGGGRSFLLLGEELLVHNLAVVTVQNQLPSAAEATPALLDVLNAETARLERTLLDAGEIVALASADREPPAPANLDPTELRLWTALAGGAPVPSLADRERGMGYGTVARSQAFMGRFAEARRAALQARELFADSAPDLRMNAAVIARLELERARLGLEGVADPEGLRAALALAGVGELRPATLARDLAQDPARRFALDLLLRAQLFSPAFAAPDPALLDALTGRALRELLASADLRSHPSELVARHAAELLFRRRGRSSDCERWFEISIALCADAPPDSTRARLAPFTRRLALEPEFSGEGPAGSVLNPTFEYR